MAILGNQRPTPESALGAFQGFQNQLFSPPPFSFMPTMMQGQGPSLAQLIAPLIFGGQGGLLGTLPGGGPDTRPGMPQISMPNVLTPGQAKANKERQDAAAAKTKAAKKKAGKKATIQRRIAESPGVNPHLGGPGGR